MTSIKLSDESTAIITAIEVMKREKITAKLMANLV